MPNTGRILILCGLACCDKKESSGGDGGKTDPEEHKSDAGSRGNKSNDKSKKDSPKKEVEESVEQVKTSD